MANKTIEQLTAGTALDGTELLHGVQGNNSRKFTALQLLTPTLGAVDQAAARAAFGVPLDGYLFGLSLSNNATDAANYIDIAAGKAASQQSPGLLMVFAGASGIQLDAVYGTGSGGRFDTSISDGTWHVFLISNGTTVGCGFSESLDPTGQANYPSGYTHYRRIGSIVRVSSAIKAFVQNGDFFRWKQVATDIADGSPGTSAVTRTLTVPTGIKVMARVTAGLGAADFLYLSDLDTNDESASAAIVSIVGAGNPSGGTVDVMTNTSGQIRSRAQAAAGMNLSTQGYWDYRGKNG